MALTGDKLKLELDRLKAMSVYEFENAAKGYVCGIDEAGRGPLAGPVVAAAVILPEDETFLYLNDSKKLSEKKRNLLFEEIKEKAIAFGIGIVDHTIIDEINILQATYEAMRIAIDNLSIKPDVLLNDAVTIPGIDIEQIPIVKGDAKSVSIAAASVLAKVTRDRIMEDLAIKYPIYGFEKHKGYGTKQHRDALLEYGPCEEHRLTFLGKILQSKNP